MGRLTRAEHAMPITAVLIALLVVVALPDSPGLGPVGSPFGPGGTTAPAVRWLALGLLLAPAVMVYAHRWAAACAAVACAAGWAVLGLGYGWRDLLPCAYAAVAVLVARHEPRGDAVALLDRRPVGGALAAAADRHAGPGLRPGGDGSGEAGGGPSASRVVIEVPRRVPPAPPGGLPPIGRRTAGLAGLLLVAAVTGLVAAGSGAPAGDGWSGRGRPEALAGAVVAGGSGIALLARVRRRRRGLRALFGTAQPVRAARVVDQLGYLHVLVPAADGRSAVEFGIDTADTFSTWDDEDGDPQTRAALLYGDPWPGDWVAAEVDGRVHVPVEPVGATTVVPYDADHGVPREVSDDEEQLVDPAALTDRDRVAAPDSAREHRVAPVRGWTSTVVIGLGAALGAAELAHLAGRSGTWIAVTAVAVAAAAGYEFGWRTQLRPRLRWHVGGLAAVGAGVRVREPWTVDTAAVHDDAGAVTITVGDSVLTVAAPPPWPSWLTPAGPPQRTGDELVAALRAARTRAFAGGELPPPPVVEVPRRPLLLVAAWALTVAGTVALFAH